MSDYRERSMGDSFRESHGRPVSYRGVTVHLGYRIEISPGSHVGKLVVRSFKDEPVQGICLKIHNGMLIVNGNKSSEMALWMDTAPRDIEVQLSSRSAAELVVWNCWKGKFGQRMEGVGSVGMLVEVNGEGIYSFRCSDGGGDVDFTAIEFELTLTGA